MSDPHTQTGTRNRVSLDRLVRLLWLLWPKDPRRSAFAKRIRCSRQKRDASTQAHDRDFYRHQAATWLSVSRIVCLPNNSGQTAGENNQPTS